MSSERVLEVFESLLHCKYLRIYKSQLLLRRRELLCRLVYAARCEMRLHRRRVGVHSRACSCDRNEEAKASAKAPLRVVHCFWRAGAVPLRDEIAAPSGRRGRQSRGGGSRSCASCAWRAFFFPLPHSAPNDCGLDGRGRGRAWRRLGTVHYEHHRCGSHLIAVRGTCGGERQAGSVRERETQ